MWQCKLPEEMSAARYVLQSPWGLPEVVCLQSWVQSHAFLTDSSESHVLQPHPRRTQVRPCWIIPFQSVRQVELCHLLFILNQCLVLLIIHHIKEKQIQCKQSCEIIESSVSENHILERKTNPPWNKTVRFVCPQNTDWIVPELMETWDKQNLGVWRDVEQDCLTFGRSLWCVYVVFMHKFLLRDSFHSQKSIPQVLVCTENVLLLLLFY